MAALLGLTILAKRTSPVKRISNWYAMIIMIWTVLRSKLPVRLLSMLDVLIFDFDSDKPDSIPSALEVSFNYYTVGSTQESNKIFCFVGESYLWPSSRPFTIADVCRDKWDLVRETIGRDNRQYTQARMPVSSQLGSCCDRLPLSQAGASVRVRPSTAAAYRIVKHLTYPQNEVIRRHGIRFMYGATQS